MERIFRIILLLGLGILLVSGCQQAQSSKEVPSGTNVAVEIGQMLNIGIMTDNLALGLLGISTLGINTADLKNLAIDLPRSGGWWYFDTTTTREAESILYHFRIKTYDIEGFEITEQELLSQTNKIVMVASAEYGSLLSFNYGTDSNPLTIDGIQIGTKSINGTINMTVIEEDEKTYTVNLTFSNIPLNAEGYPTSGSSTFSITSPDYVAVAGTITYNGTTATQIFTSPAELTGTTYTIDMTTGLVE